MKNEKGITMIVLIITIVIMLILLGVSVTTALNGGLINTTQEAADTTKIRQDLEQLQTAVILAIGNDGRVNFTKLETSLPDGFIEKNGVYISGSGNRFTIDNSGNVEPYVEE